MTPTLARAAWPLPLLLLAGCGGGGSSGGMPMTAPTAGAVSQTIVYNPGSAAATGVMLSLGGGAATSVAVAGQASHGTATASGTSISYTPAAFYIGADSFTYTATNSVGTSGAATVSITVSAPAITVAPSTLPGAAPTVAYAQTLSASGGHGPYTFAVTAGALPGWLGLTVAGVLSGTPPAVGTANFTVTATDSSTPTAATGSQAYTLTVASPNSFAVTIDSGPLPSTFPTVNVIYTTITICPPGSTTGCLPIDHIQVDTASYGLRILAGETSGVLPTLPAVRDPASTNPLFECVIFADGYTWGSVVSADVQIGGRTIASLPIHIIADAPSGVTAPSECSTGHGTAENQVSQFGANGLLGIGPFLEDCPVCVSGAAHPAYYVCPGGACTSTAVSVANQIQNPVALLASDNNGVTVKMPAVVAPGATTLNGTVYFGVGTQPDNAVGAATWLALNNVGEFTTSYAAMTLAQSFTDTGSNGYFFNKASSDTVLQTCTLNKWAYCPAATTPEMATIDPGGTNRLINFSVDNADNDFATTNDVAFPNLAGPATAANAPSNSFDWGLPFFFGRTVFVLFDTKTAGAVTGPATAF